MGSMVHITSLFCVACMTPCQHLYALNRAGTPRSAPSRRGSQVVENLVEKKIRSSVNGLLGVFGTDLLS